MQLLIIGFHSKEWAKNSDSLTCFWPFDLSIQLDWFFNEFPMTHDAWYIFFIDSLNNESIKNS